MSTFVREVISLGKSCQIDWFLKTRNLRRSTYVFDNMIADRLESVTDLLKTDFHDFLLEKNMEIVKRNMWGCFTVRDQSNGIYSVHDFSQSLKPEDAIASVRDRKLQAASELCGLIRTCREKLLFVRVNNDSEPLEESIRLFDTLSCLRDTRPFQLFLFQRHPMMRKGWGIPQVSTFYDGPWEFDRGSPETGWWRGDVELWDQIFSEVRLVEK